MAYIIKMDINGTSYQKKVSASSAVNAVRKAKWALFVKPGDDIKNLEIIQN